MHELDEYMWKCTKLVLITVVVAVVGYIAYDSYKAGLHTRPDMPAGAFSLSYKNGMRAILVDVPDERQSRRYLGTPMKVPFYLGDAWSFCYPPNNDEMAQFATLIRSREWPGERFEAVCKITVDSEVVVRGFITTVLKL